MGFVFWAISTIALLLGCAIVRQVKREVESWLRPMLVEFVVYGVLVTAYFFLVLHFLGDHLHNLFLHDRALYSFLALVLIAGQGLVLEILTRVLLGWFKRLED